MAKRRKVSNLLALAILALLGERPMHPYGMASVLRERGKATSLKINWGSLYTVVDNLEKHGLIQAAHTTRQGRRPERTVYRITAAGAEEMRDWLRELIRVPEKEFPRFATALSELPGLPPDEARELLEQRMATLDAENAELRADLKRVGETVPRLFLIEAEYELALRETEARWTRSLLDDLRDGSLPGLSGWRSFHETGRLPGEFTDPAE